MSRFERFVPERVPSTKAVMTSRFHRVLAALALAGALSWPTLVAAQGVVVAGELTLAMPAAPAPEVAPATPTEVPPQVIVAEASPATTPPAAPTEPAPPVLLVVEISSATLTPSAPIEPSDAELDADIDAALDVDAAAPFEPGLVSLGLSGLVGTRSGHDELLPTWTAGFDVGVRIDDLVSLGARRINVVATAQGDEHWGMGLSPYVELGWRPWERIEGYGQLGAALEVSFDDGDFGAAPFGGVGVRFFPADVFSIAVEGALHVPATNRFVLGHETFPTGAVILQGGLAFAFHLG